MRLQLHLLARQLKTINNYYTSSTKRTRCEKIDKLTKDAIRLFITESSNSATNNNLINSNVVNNILTPSENDELNKINYTTLTNEQQKQLTQHLIKKVTYSEGSIKIEIDRISLETLHDYQNVSERGDVNDAGKVKIARVDTNIKNTHTLPNQTYLSTDGKTINIIIDTQAIHITSTKTNKTLIKAIVTSYEYKRMIEYTNETIDSIAKKCRKNRDYISRITNIAYLSPRIIEYIFKAKHKESLTLTALQNISIQSMDWRVQEEMFNGYR